MRIKHDSKLFKVFIMVAVDIKHSRSVNCYFCIVVVVIIISIETSCPDFICEVFESFLLIHLDFFWTCVPTGDDSGVWRTAQASCSPSADPLVSRTR